MLQFLQSHWRELASLIVLIVSFVLCLLRKPVSSSLDSDIISDLSVLIAGWIRQVECDGNGEYKKETVEKLALHYLKKRYIRSLTDDELAIWTKRISTIIELFLSTPQKKEVLYENKTKK